MKGLRTAAILTLLSSGLAIGQIGSGRGMGYTVIGPNGPIPGIKNAPFSAETLTTTAQTLADGNHIRREQHGTIFRDSEGRVRKDEEAGFFSPPGSTKPRHITIQDPVQQVMIFLQPGPRWASVHHLPRSAPSMGGQSLPTRPKISDSQPAKQCCTAITGRGIQASSEDLGRRDIEGITVLGTRTRQTIEAGQIGNEKPLVTINESWYSPELGMELFSKRDDPQSGQTITKIVNIQRGEPDPALFQIPPDYTVHEDKPQQ